MFISLKEQLELILLGIIRGGGSVIQNVKRSRIISLPFLLLFCFYLYFYLLFYLFLGVEIEQNIWQI